MEAKGPKALPPEPVTSSQGNTLWTCSDPPCGHFERPISTSSPANDQRQVRGRRFSANVVGKNSIVKSNRHSLSEQPGPDDYAMASASSVAMAPADLTPTDALPSPPHKFYPAEQIVESTVRRWLEASEVTHISPSFGLFFCQLVISYFYDEPRTTNLALNEQAEPRDNFVLRQKDSTSDHYDFPQATTNSSILHKLLCDYCISTSCTHAWCLTLTWLPFFHLTVLFAVKSIFLECPDETSSRAGVAGQALEEA